MKKVYYVMDVLCGWCFGVSDEINKLQNKYKDEFEFVVVPGGMWTGNYTQQMNGNLATYIREHNKSIEKLSGKKFGLGFNEMLDSKRVLDSLPGSKAIVLAQKMNKNLVFDFVREVQNAFFVEGKDLNDNKVYLEIAENLGLDKENFEKELKSEKLEKETFEYFQSLSRLKVRSFPTIIFEDNGDLKQIAQGYSTMKEMEKNLL